MATKTHQLFTCVFTSTVIGTIGICAKLLSLILQLSRQLQSPIADLVQAITHLNGVEATVVQLQDLGFPSLLQTAQRLYEQVNPEIEIPRAYQRHLNNNAMSIMEEYFRVFIFLPFLDHFHVQMAERFRSQTGTIKLPFALLPQNITAAEKDIDIEEFVTLYGGFVSSNILYILVRFSFGHRSGETAPFNLSPRYKQLAFAWRLCTLTSIACYRFWLPFRSAQLKQSTRFQPFKGWSLAPVLWCWCFICRRARVNVILQIMNITKNIRCSSLFQNVHLLYKYIWIHCCICYIYENLLFAMLHSNLCLSGLFVFISHALKCFLRNWVFGVFCAHSYAGITV